MREKKKIKNFYDYPEKERLKVIKKATEDSMKEQSKLLTNPKVGG